MKSAIKESNSENLPIKFTGAKTSLIHLSNSGFPFNARIFSSVYIHLEGKPFPYTSLNPYRLKKATSLEPERYSVSSFINSLNFSIVFCDIIIFLLLTTNVVINSKKEEQYSKNKQLSIDIKQSKLRLPPSE